MLQFSFRRKCIELKSPQTLMPLPLEVILNQWVYYFYKLTTITAERCFIKKYWYLCYIKRMSVIFYSTKINNPINLFQSAFITIIILLNNGAGKIFEILYNYLLFSQKWYPYLHWFVFIPPRSLGTVTFRSIPIY